MRPLSFHFCNLGSILFYSHFINHPSITQKKKNAIHKHTYKIGINLGTSMINIPL